MEKIKQTFINLYSGEDALKKHLIYATLLILPALTSTAFNLVEKTNPAKLNIILFLIGLVFFIVSIPMYIAILGFFFKFINNKLNNAKYPFPYFDASFFKPGLKGIVPFLVWGGYMLILCIVYILGIVAIIIAMNINTNNLPMLILLFGMILLFTIAFVVGIFIITPFINLIYVKFSKNFEYSKDLFSPVTVYKYMSTSFEPVFILAVKYMLISAAINISAYIIIFIVAIIFGLLTYFASNGTEIEGHVDTMFIYIGSFVAIWAMSYISAIISFAYVDNVCEIFPAIEEASSKVKINELDTDKDI